MCRPSSTPDRILIEPSGVGKLSDVIVAVENTVADTENMKLNSFVTVADATKVKVYMKNFGEFYNNQIEAAGTILLSRTQKLSQEKLDAAVAMLREKNPGPPSSPLPGTSWTARPILSAIEKVSWPTNCWRRCVEHAAEEAGTPMSTIMTTTMIMRNTSITTIMTMTTRNTSTTTITTTTMSATIPTALPPPSSPRRRGVHFLGT